jgi:hypothetical protein
LSWWYFGSGISERHWQIIPTAEWPSEKIPSTMGRAAKIYLVRRRWRGNAPWTFVLRGESVRWRPCPDELQSSPHFV